MLTLHVHVLQHSTCLLAPPLISYHHFLLIELNVDTLWVKKEAEDYRRELSDPGDNSHVDVYDDAFIVLNTLALVA